MVDSDKESGFNCLPLDAASVSYHQALPLQPTSEIEPRVRPKAGYVSRSGRLSSRNSDSYADGCFARALATAEATKTASLIIAELLEFAAEGVTCFQNRIAPTLVEAAQALLHGGHSDFLHREFTLCIALVLSLFCRACGPVQNIGGARGPPCPGCGC